MVALVSGQHLASVQNRVEMVHRGELGSVQIPSQNTAEGTVQV